MPLSGNVSLADKMVYFCNAFLRDLPDPFSIIDDKFRIVWGNRKNAEVHQHRQADIIGEVCYDIFFKKDTACSPCAVTMARKSGRPCTVKKKCALSNGNRVWCEQRAVPLFDQNQNLASFLVYGIIVTDTKLNEKRQDEHIEHLEDIIIEINERKNKFIANENSHQLQATLSNRELEVLHLVAQGCTNSEISQSLAISTHTVKTHMISIFNKLGVNNRTQAAVAATFHDLIPL
jgi:DNA-binding CsgD family transcriptional regulator